MIRPPMRIEVLNGDDWSLVKEINPPADQDTFEVWRAVIKETWALQEATGQKHRAVTIDCGLRAIWCNGSSYWCGY